MDGFLDELMMIMLVLVVVEKYVQRDGRKSTTGSLASLECATNESKTAKALTKMIEDDE